MKNVILALSLAMSGCCCAPISEEVKAERATARAEDDLLAFTAALDEMLTFIEENRTAANDAEDLAIAQGALARIRDVDMALGRAASRKTWAEMEPEYVEVIPAGKSVPEFREELTEYMSKLEAGIVSLEAKAKMVTASCREAVRQLGSSDRGLTDMQRDAEFESSYKGKTFEWSLKVDDVTETFGTVSVAAYCAPRSDSRYTPDMRLTVPDGLRDAAISLRKGSAYTFTGEFNSAGDFLGLGATLVSVK